MTDVAQQNLVELKEENILVNRNSSLDQGEGSSKASVEALQQSNVENKVENETEEDKEIRKEIEQKMEARRTLIRKECMGSKKRLDLGFSNIDDLDAYTIAMCLNEKEPILELLHLGANKLSGEGLRVILTGLQWHIKLKELYLGNNKIDHEGIEDFIEILPIFQELQMLGIGNIGLDDNLGVLLGSSLGCLPNLKSVVLNTNNLSDQTFVKLSTLLFENQLACSTLHIGDNKPTAIGLVALFQSLENNKTVKNLHINDMYIGGDAVRALNKMLVKNTTLEQLNLGNCEIEDEAISLMKFGLMCNQTLKSLYLWGNKITNEGAYLMKMILEDHNFGLTALMLSNNYIDDEEIQNEIKLLLKRNEKFESIQKAANGSFQVLEAVMNLKNEQENNTIIEHQNKASKIQTLDKEIKEAERKIEEAKREMILIKETLEPSMNKEDEKTRKD